MKRLNVLITFLTRLVIPVTAGVLPLGLCYSLPTQSTVTTMASRVALAAQLPPERTDPQLPPIARKNGTGVEPKIAVTTEELESVVRRIDRLSSDDSPSHLQLAPQIRWDRLSVFSAHAMSQGELRTNIALLFNFRWKPDANDQSQSNLLLEMPAEERLIEQRLWRKTMDLSVKPMVDLARYARLPAGHWAKAKIACIDGANDDFHNPVPVDPLLREGNFARLGYSFTHAGMEFIGALNQDQLRTLVDEGRLVLPWSSMSAEQQGFAVESCVREPKHRLSDDLHPLTADEETAADQADSAWIRRHGIDITALKDADTGLVRFVALSRGNGPEGVIVFDTHGSLNSLLPVRGSPYQSVAAAPDGKKTPFASPPDLSAYADVDRLPFPEGVAKILGNHGKWPDVLKALSLAVDMPVFSDDFQAARSLKRGKRVKSPPETVSYVKLSLATGLDAMCKDKGYLWWRENGALFFRSRTWFIEQLYEMPPPVLERLSKQTLRGTKMTADAVDTLSELPLHQLEGLAGLSAARIADDSIGQAPDMS